MGFFDFLSGKNKKKELPASQSMNAAEKEDLLMAIEVKPGINLPRVIAHQWAAIEKTALPCINIKAIPEKDLSLEQSKFGGYPCLPAGFDWPRDADGKYMYPLAQINCSEMPALEGYPQSGYLQFYISTNDTYGLEFDNPQSQRYSRVLYFTEAEVAGYQADLSYIDEVLATEDLPMNQSFRLEFERSQTFLGVGDMRYEEAPEGTPMHELKTKLEADKELEEEISEALYDNFSYNGHRIGGYAYFTQYDPRGVENHTAGYILLLQIDSDDHIMWGDVGVANFFIHPDDLQRRDFSKVLYNWDCC